MRLVKRTSAALLLGMAMTGGEAVAQDPITISGAPQKAEVRFESLIGGVPPEAYALGCAGLPDCSTTGKVDLVVASTVQAAHDPAKGTTRGSAPLPYTSVSGDVRREVACRDAPPYASAMTQVGTQPGLLAVTSIHAKPGVNTIAVTINPAGESSEAYPLELGKHVIGGCGVTPETYTLEHPLWYSSFKFAHQDEWPKNGTEGVELQGLAWNADAGAFVKDYDRVVEIPMGLSAHPVVERTRIEVKPKFCEGKFNRIARATADGQSLGLDGMSFFPGQVITAPRKTKLHLADGTYIEVGDGASWRIEKCDERGATFELLSSVRKFWAEIKKAISGSRAKFEVKTERQAAGVRGTKYMLSYDKARQLTRVAVKEGAVSMRGINGAKGKVLIRAGQAGVQRGKRRPRLVKR